MFYVSFYSGCQNNVPIADKNLPPACNSGNWDIILTIILTLERIKMIVAISSRIPIHNLGFSDALADHILGCLFIIRAGFLFFLAFQAYGRMIING
jgi:hypothetical protein